MVLPQTDFSEDLLSHDGGSFEFRSSAISNFYTYGDWVYELLSTCAADGDACEVGTSGGSGTPWAVRNYDAEAGTADLVFTEAGARQFNDLAGAGDPVIQVFVTNAPGNGNLGGLSGADTICTDAAESGGLSGEWTAWLSDSTTDARDRLGEGEYRLPDGVTIETGTLVATSLADLTDGTLTNPIDKTAAGEPIGALSVWTGTKPDGTLADGTPDEVSCDDWTNGMTGLDGASGVEGALGATDVTWTEASTSECSASNQLYCLSRRPFRAEMLFATTFVPEPSAGVLSTAAPTTLVGLRRLSRRRRR